MSLHTSSATKSLVSSKGGLNAILIHENAHRPGCLRREETCICPLSPEWKTLPAILQVEAFEVVYRLAPRLLRVAGGRVRNLCPIWLGQ